MTPSLPPQAPGRVRWRWGRIVLLVLAAGIGALGWNQYTWHRAVRPLEEAGFYGRPVDLWTGRQDSSVGERLRWAAQNDWRRFLSRDTWTDSIRVWTMDYDQAAQLRNLEALAPALRRINPDSLTLAGCKALENVAALNGIAGLKSLELTGCPALRNVDSLKDITALEWLDLSRCPSLQDVNGLKRLAALQEIDLSYCPSLENIEGLRGLTSLQVLGLRDCVALKSVDALHGLTSLVLLDLVGCTKLPPEQVAALRAALPNTEIQYP